MKRTFAALLAFSCLALGATVSKTPAPARYESFEDGIPKTWVLQGKGKLSTNAYHYKLGKKSLQWDFVKGDVIRVNNTLGDINARGGHGNCCYATFGVWIYSKKPMPGKSLRFEFREKKKNGAYFDFPLNFKGWQCAFVKLKTTYNKKLLKGKISPATDNILIKAPDVENGTILIDCLVYNGLAYYWADFVPREKPWQAPKLDAKKFPLPDKVSEKDLKAIEQVKKILLPAVKVGNGKAGTSIYNQSMDNIRSLNIIEDSHGIRGLPIQLPRDHCTSDPNRIFFTGNGIPDKEINDFTYMITYGGLRKEQKLHIIPYSTYCVRLGLDAEQFKNLSAKHVKLWKYLLDQGFNSSYNDRAYYTNRTVVLFTGAYVFRNALFNAGLMKDVWDFIQCPNYGLFEGKSKNISMDYFYGATSFYIQAFLYSNDTKEQLRALRFIAGKLSTEIISDYGACGFKPDGAGYHCTGHGGGYTAGGVMTLAKIFRATAGSSFALSQAAYDTVRRTAWSFYFYSNHGEQPLLMQGTDPFRKKAKVLYLTEILKNMALGQPDSTLDKDLAQAYINLNPQDIAFAKKYGITPGKLPQGNIVMPYVNLTAQRRNGWVAVAGGSGPDMRDRGNHYAYHMGNGPLEIIGKDGLSASGNQEAGWDWNRTNGVTCLYMPDITNIKYIHSGRKVPPGKGYVAAMLVKQQCASKTDPVIKRGNSGISWRNTNGTYRKIFLGDKLYNDFRGIKSYFFIDDRIYALGSNIKSDNKKYHVQTNLYQKALKTKDTPTYVDGREIKTFPAADQQLDGKKAHYLVDPVGNGYYVPANQKLFVARKTQKSRNTKFKKHTDSIGDFATAWLEHGVECQDGKYAYVVMPYCDKSKLAKFSDKDYEILRQDDFAHILHDKIDNFYAGIFFKGGNVKKLPHVANVERDCHIMYREGNKKLEIALGDPDVHRNWTDKLPFGHYGGPSTLTALKVTFTGPWKLETPVDGIKVLSSNKDQTVIEFACIHGKTFNFTLIK